MQGDQGRQISNVRLRLGFDLCALAHFARVEEIEDIPPKEPNCLTKVYLQEKLKLWAIRNQVSHKTFSELLTLLAEDGINVPKSAEY